MFGYASVVFGCIYFLYEYCCAKYLRKSSRKLENKTDHQDEEETGEEMETFVSSK